MTQGALYDYQDPVATAQPFDALLPAASADQNLQLELELLTQIARTHALKHQPEQA